MASKRDSNFPMQGKLGYMGGKYGRKAENLTKKELKAAGGSKAAATRKVDITKTTRDTTRGLTLGPKGKPLTGSVTLSNGNTAVYKAGKRVMKAAAPARSSSGGGSGSSPAPKKVAAYTPGRKQGAGSRTSELLKQAKASRGNNTRYSPSAGGPLSKASAAKAEKSSVSQAAKKNPFLGGRAAGVSKKKDGTYSTNSGVTGKTAEAAMRRKKQIDKNNEGRDSAIIASMALAPLALAGGSGAGAAGLLARGASALRVGGLRGVAGRGADARLAKAISNYKPKPAAAKPTPKPAAKPRAAKPAPLSKLKADEWDLRVVTKAGKRYASDQKAQNALDKQLAKGTSRQRAARKGAETRAKNKAAAAKNGGKK